ncbi:hypothetical protein PGB90_007641 [Kerria lacca]
MTTDRLTFKAEWKDTLTSINWKFNLFFYPSDGTIELYDLIKHRLFLKRTKCEDISAEDLFIGATLRIYSRLIHITDYGDSYTCHELETHLQKVCGFLKPEIGNKKGKILKLLSNYDLKIINLKMIQLTESRAKNIFEEYEDASILKSMIEHIISGPILAFEILGKNAINICLDLIGPEDPDNARKMYPETVRAQYGIDKIRNGIHVSTSTKSAERDSKILFDPNGYTCDYLNSATLNKNIICCVIKPHAVKSGQIGEIINMIEESGYHITSIYMCTLNTEQAEKFHEVYKYVLPEYQDMIQELCSGPCVALEVKNESGEEIYAEFRKFVGPLNADIAKIIRPDTVRGRFGKTNVQNSLHVTDLIDDIKREEIIEKIFNVEFVSTKLQKIDIGLKRFL